MERMRAPDPWTLRVELVAHRPPPGEHRPSVLQVGCEGCPWSSRLVTGGLSLKRLVTIVNEEQGIPRAFAMGHFTDVGQAETCPKNDDSTPDCQHKAELQTLAGRLHAPPEDLIE